MSTTSTGIALYVAAVVAILFWVSLRFIHVVALFYG
jgi:hypothetical protein